MILHIRFHSLIRLFFLILFNQSRTEVVSHLSKENGLRNPSLSKSNLSSKLARYAKLWIPFGKSSVLHGVIIDGKAVAEEPAGARGGDDRLGPPSLRPFGELQMRCGADAVRSTAMDGGGTPAFDV